MSEIRVAGAARSVDLRRRSERRSIMDRRAFLAAAASVPVSLAWHERSRAASVKVSQGPVRRLALVTADLEGHVVAVDLATSRIVERIPTAPGPRSIETVGDVAVVAHTALGRLSLIDAGSLAVRRTLDGFAAPRYTAANEVLAYVTDSGRRELVTVDIVRGAVVSRTRLPGPARHVTLTPGGATIWTALGSKAPTIAVLDVSRPRQPRLTHVLRPPFLAHDVVAAPDGDHVWVTSGDRRAIAVYDAGRRRPLELLDAGAPPQHIAFTHDRALVTSGDDGSVHTHRLDGRLVRAASVPVGSFNVSVGGRAAVSPSLARGTLTVLGADGRVRSTRRVARAAHDACLILEEK